MLAPAYNPPLYLPRVILQAGQLWVTACMLSTQKGMRQQGQIPNTQRAPHMIQAMALLSDLVLRVEGHERGGLIYLLTAYLVVIFC